MSIRYEIEEGTNSVKVFYGDSELPSLYQPHWPNNTPWKNAEEAEDWAKLYVASVEDEDAPFAPNGPGEEAPPRPSKEIEAKINEKLKEIQAILLGNVE
jgi:hypothetical protein